MLRQPATITRQGGTHRRGTELLLFSDKIDANEALSLGLVTRVFAADRLREEARAAASRLAAAPAFALRATKANILSAEKSSMRAYVEIETARHLHVASGGALRAGLAALRDGRPPPDAEL